MEEVGERPFSQACENNKQPILEVLQQYLGDVDYVLEVGSGTGQHALHFAAALPHLQWQCTDQPIYLPGIESWRRYVPLANMPQALALEVSKAWPVSSVPAIFSANTLHIMGWDKVECFFQGVDRVLQPGGILCVYGPFNYGGQFTSDSNARFDQWLRQQDERSGIRNFEAVHSLAESIGLTLRNDHPMPANNRCLVWQRNG